MNRVQIYRTVEKTRFLHEGWELNPRGRLAWLQRLFWRALGKMGALSPAMNEYVEVLRFPMDNDSVFRCIFESQSDLFMRHRRPSEVLIGPNTLSELIACPELRDYPSPISFNAHCGFGKTIFNLPIRVVPQMEGVVVLDER
jgi:hypothetical protein